MKGISRRAFLQVGGATLILAAGGSVWRAVGQGIFSAGQGPAYAPWQEWRSAATPAERLAAAGILAANPHNSQPWIFRLAGEAIDLFADPGRQIGVIDPFRREMYIGLGCALENMLLAAEAEGLAVDLRLLPDPADETHAAHLTIGPGPQKAAELYAAIPQRHTDRAPYDTARRVGAETLEAISGLVTGERVRLFWFADDAGRAAFSRVAVAAAEALVADEQQSLDSHAWWRQDWSELQQRADGITLDTQALGPVVTALAKFLPDGPRRQNDQIFVRTLRQSLLPTAAAFGILAVEDGRDPARQMECGRVWQRIHLWGTTRGLAFQPLNQMCERADRERQLGISPVFGEAVRSLLGDDQWRGIMPFRMGYPTQPAFPSPRRSLAEVSI